MMGKLFALVLPLALLFNACSPAYTKYIKSYAAGVTGGAPDYALPVCWAAHPGKHDPSDSVPLPLRRNLLINKPADVFFIHPTTYTSKNDGAALNADINNARLNAKTDYTTILYQASVFNYHCRVYAPRYRQARLDVFFMKDTVAAAAAFDTAYADVKAAFEYYLQHENKGRPIIIAAHSQGTVHAGRLLKAFFENKPLMRQLVAAYIIGMPLPKSYFAVLQPCSNAAATGCFTGWRTFKTGYMNKYAKNEPPGYSYVINPLTWNTGTETAERRLNKGAVLKNFNKIYPAVCNARVHGNVLWVQKPRFPFSFLVRMRNYHVGDINLFYMNIRENINERLTAFLNRNRQ